MATSINVDYSTTIPNNIGLSEDRRVLKALERWHPGYLDWWNNMGPDGFQEKLVYLRTAVSVDLDGWAKFGYVRLMTRCTPVAPTNMWWASSVSINRQVRDSGSKPDCANASSCILPSRSVKVVNMKNDSQSGVASLKAPNMRGWSSLPD